MSAIWMSCGGAACVNILFARATLRFSSSSSFTLLPLLFASSRFAFSEGRTRASLSTCYSIGIRNLEVSCEGDHEEEEFSVVNFYKFVGIDEPRAEILKHLEFLHGLDICGRIYLSEQGINAQYSGPTANALEYADWIREDERFSDVLVQISSSPKGHVFPRLKLRYKSSLVQLEGGISHLPLLDYKIRATPLAPLEWRKRLETMKDKKDGVERKEVACSDKKFVLLDVRNGYEWDVGHFEGAERPNVDCFRSTSFGHTQKEVESSDPLGCVDKENIDVLMYCTGGIRCDVYFAILRQKGFRNLYTLSGGVSNYLKNEGSTGWVGNLFVFDARLALPPSIYKPGSITLRSPEFPDNNNSFARCAVCGSRLLEFRHRNCANLDCNLLFLCCIGCTEELRGCCCLDCIRARRLRPVLPSHQRYERWHIYRDAEPPESRTSLSGGAVKVGGRGGSDSFELLRNKEH